MRADDNVPVVTNYLRHYSPKTDIMDAYEQDRHSHGFGVKTDAGVLLVSASVEFLTDASASSLAALLEKWDLGGAMTAAGPSKRIIVTREGLQVATR